MRQRGVLFTTILVLVALIVTGPIVIYGGGIAMLSYQFAGRLPFYFFGFDRNIDQGSILSDATMVLDRFHWYSVDEEGPTDFQLKFYSADPESGYGINQKDGDSRLKPIRVSSPAAQNPEFCIKGDATHFWVVEVGSLGVIYEFDGTHFIEHKPLHFDQPGLPETTSSVATSLRSAFVMNSKLTLEIALKHDFGCHGSLRGLIQLDDGVWRSLGEVVLLDTERSWENAEHETLITAQPDASAPANGARRDISYFELIQIRDATHLFWRYNDRLLYRRGIALTPTKSGTWELIKNQESLHFSEEPTSALEPTNVVGIASDWFLVADNLPVPAKASKTSHHLVGVGGEPALVEIDVAKKGHPRARALRMKDGRWREFASTELPFASQNFNVTSLADGSIAYLIATTFMGRSQVIALEPTEFRLTKFDHSPLPDGLLQGYFLVGFVLVLSLIAGLILASAATFLMWRDEARYDFGDQSITLASVWERLMARAFDVAFVLLIAMGVFFAMAFLLHPDWRTASEAWNIEIFDHPSLVPAERIVIACLASLIVTTLALIVTQGQFGLTPGKWICGLRTVRATLKPCGFARSLLRELLLCIDSLNLISWTPGILCIAYTDYRQRFGDLAADTLVVRAKSLTSGTSPV